MTSHPPPGRLLASAVVAGTVVLGGCGAATQSRAGMMGDTSLDQDSTSTCLARGPMPVNGVSIRLWDMGMTRMMGGRASLVAPMRLSASPAVVTAGPVSLVAVNMGWRTHEVVLLPLPDGVGEGQRVPGPDGRIDESGSLGETSNSCGPDSGGGIRSGAAGWTTVDLSPGRYELVCNLENHYANGMYQELDVQ